MYKVAVVVPVRTDVEALYIYKLCSKYQIDTFVPLYDNNFATPKNAYNINGIALLCPNAKVATASKIYLMNVDANKLINSYDKIILVECDGPYFKEKIKDKSKIIYIDHHRPGDPGYNRPPEEFWIGSSIGQFVQILCTYYKNVPTISCDFHCDNNIWYPTSSELLYVAAADHCLIHAYQGRCPSVYPAELLKFRVKHKARHNKTSKENIMKAISYALSLINKHYDASKGYADLTGYPNLEELNEAAAISGITVLCKVTAKGHGSKIIIYSPDSEKIRDFMNNKIYPNIIDIYGDPIRGFAGGWIKNDE